MSAQSGRAESGDRQAGRDGALDRYVDGVMSEPERAAFERELAQNAELRAMVDADRSVARSLRLAFAPPAELGHRIDPPASVAPRGLTLARRRVVVRLALAAMLAIVGVVGVWAVLGGSGGASAFARTYREIVADGFVPFEVCTTDDEFERWTKDRLGVGLSPQKKDASVQYLGWSYRKVLRPYTSLLLVRVDGREVMVALERNITAADLPKEGSAGASADHLKLFRREVGGVWMVEITPLDTPRVLGLIESTGK